MRVNLEEMKRLRLGGAPTHFPFPKERTGAAAASRASLCLIADFELLSLRNSFIPKLYPEAITTPPGGR